MFTHDITRHLLQPRKHYTGVRMQQRRTITEADFGEGESIRDEIVRRTRVDLLGESGSPDLGYRVDPDSLETLPDGTVDFAISAGRLYVGGRPLELFEDERFRYQGDWLQHRDSDRPSLPAATRQDVVFLMAWQAVVTAAEDTELYDASLGPGVDASVRVRQYARVMVWSDADGDDCDQAWADASSSLLDALCPGSTLAPDGELISPIRLTVGFSGATQTEDPCAPCVDGPTGGYLAAQNQAIRVAVVGDGTQYTWGFDNASPLYRVRLTGTTIEVLDPLPSREELHPLRGQTVELLPWGARLDNGEKAAESLGFFTEVSRSFDARDGTLELQLAPPPGTFVDDWTGHPHEDDLPDAAGHYLFMRVWRRGTDRSSDPVRSIPALGTSEALGNTGLTVEFSALQGVPGDYWVITARRDDPARLSPWDLQDVSGASPHGPRRFLAPLGRIQWTVAGDGTLSFDVTDCRPRFRALAERSECCTITAGQGPGACATGFATIQAAIDALPAAGGTICVLPGTYPERIRIEDRTDVRIRGCGPRTRIINPLGPGQVTSGQDPPLVLVCNSQRVTLENFAVEADGIAGVRLVRGTQGNGSPPRDITLRELQITTKEAAIAGTTDFSQARSALESFDATVVRVEECELQMVAPLSVFPAVFLLGHDLSLEDCRISTTGAATDVQPWGGVQVPGGADDVSITNCDIEGGLGHAITLGSVNYAPLDATGQPLLAEQTAVPVGVAAFSLEDGSARVGLFAQLRDEDDQPRHPVPGPAVSRVRIRRNRIHGAQTSGIGAAAFWPDLFINPPRPSAITLVDVTIEDNVISGNARGRPSLTGLTLQARLPGVGGISLPAVAGLRVLDNRIVDNGPSHTFPVVGVYVQEGAALELSGNTITGNGARSTSAIVVRRGRRGGIVVMRGTDDGADFLSGDPSVASQLPPAPRSALVVRDNVVAQPEGKALYAPDLLGSALVVGNAFSSQGDAAPVVDTLDVVQLEVAVLPTGSSVLDRRSSTGLGAVVYLRNNVRSIDAFTTSAGARTGGRIAFDTNRVSLDWLDLRVPGPQLCAVLIDALYDDPQAPGEAAGAGDVSLTGNRFQAVMHGTADPTLLGDPTRNILLAHVVALGRSVRLVSNRIAEGRTDAQISAFVVGQDLPPWACLNNSTHCIVAYPDGIPTIAVDNAVLGAAGTTCTFNVSPSGVRSWLVQEQPVPA